ncbi:MAG: multicopper oxidase family protein [Candidatus Nanopelagicales bacterium]
MSLTRRQFVTGLAGTGAIVAGASVGASRLLQQRGGTPIPLVTSDLHAMTGKLRNFSLVAAPTKVDLGGTVVETWAYGNRVPGPVLRATAGDRIKVAFHNQLPAPTSVHWHGLAIRNDMDGVPGVTTPPTAAGGRFNFDFVVPDPGTHWFHPHTGLQMDRGLYAPFIIDDPREPGAYDREWVVVLDDWTDGVGPSPEQNLARLQADGGPAHGNGDGMMGGMGGMGGMMSADGGDVSYPLFLINGRPTNDPEVLAAKPGQRLRVRMINASADTIYNVALGDHTLTVTHSDGYPVQPALTKSIRIGMGERYDFTVTLKDGVYPLVAAPVGKTGLARALVRTSAGAAPGASAQPRELDSDPLTADRLRVALGAALPARDPSSTQELILSGSMAPYVWTINGATYEHASPLTIRRGETGRFLIRNLSMMSHPMHFHGHTFQLGGAGGTGPRKDTVLVPPMAAFPIDLQADNPGRWMVHCHNIYHAEAGMMTRLDYVS